jgi:hypothetical protein
VCAPHASSAGSPLCLFLQAYKGIKAIIAAVIFSHIDPQTGTNPTFEALGYVAGNTFQDTAVGPPPPGAAEQEELLASATVHMPGLIDTLGSAAAVQVRSRLQASAVLVNRHVRLQSVPLQCEDA